MSFLFGGGKSAKPQFTDISINTSIATLPVPMIWGCAAAAINLLWYGNFQAIAVKQSGGKGGGGGCFAPETKVLTPDGHRYIEDMRPGDPIYLRRSRDGFQNQRSRQACSQTRCV